MFPQCQLYKSKFILNVGVDLESNKRNENAALFNLTAIKTGM